MEKRYGVDVYMSSSCDTRFGAPLDDTDSEVLELREEVERLRAALVERQAMVLGWECDKPELHRSFQDQARAELIAEGLLPH